MPTLIECPSCRRQLQVPDELIGRQVQCPSCNLTFTTTAAGTGQPPRMSPLAGSPGAPPLSGEGQGAGILALGGPGTEDEARRARARSRVIAPAICLLIVGILGILSPLQFVLSLKTLNREALEKQIAASNPPKNAQEREMQEKIVDVMMNLKEGNGYIIGALLAGVALVIALAGGLMLARKARWLSLTGSVLAMVYLPCCCLGLPIGIWSLIVLLSPDVTAAYRT